MAEYFLGQIQGKSVTITQIYSGTASSVGEYSMSGNAEDFDFLVVVHGYGDWRKIDWIKTDIANEVKYNLVYGYSSTAFYVSVKNFYEGTFTVSAMNSEPIYGIFGIKF